MLATLTVLLLGNLPQQSNALAPAEIKAGWKLLFDGRTTKGWHNYRAKTIGSGWQVRDGTLAIVDPERAGDIVTDEQFGWFDLRLEFNMGKGENSGVMYHVTNLGEETWHTGPEIQLYDNKSPGVQKTGWLYQLYESKVDTAKPAGEWNHLRIVVAPDKCRTYLNGALYNEYELWSKDFWARVAKSKFRDKPYFAKARRGSIAIQGDHGLVAFRNIKIRPLKSR